MQKDGDDHSDYGGAHRHGRLGHCRAGQVHGESSEWLSFADFRGYEDRHAVGPSYTDATNVMRLIVANPVMISAYKNGIPGNGKPFPEGSKIAKILVAGETGHRSPVFCEFARHGAW
jgi:hypothetical protein